MNSSSQQKTGAWPWLAAAAVLIVLGGFVTGDPVGTVILACGFLALLGAGIRVISRNDPTPPEERRVPAGRSGV